ncbi:MAG TPA: type II toxin-antitoxin system RelE/ParE family toxin [Novimethylophilus sp.]|jgi:toxin ParE1/3/4|uniref:type II toxin-antitoxin system RelE/ParE family toxin n=1 Tax=Novimethylophilus sp. TaxID=2137426 RepID=UPI002F428948
MSVRFAGAAETDLLDLWLTIAEDNPTAADRVLGSIYGTAILIGAQPEMGRARPDLGDELRSFPTRTPYIISMYRTPMVSSCSGYCTMHAISALNIFKD